MLPLIKEAEHETATNRLDVLACLCGGRRAFVADISASEVVVAILAHLGLPTGA